MKPISVFNFSEHAYLQFNFRNLSYLQLIRHHCSKTIIQSFAPDSIYFTGSWLLTRKKKDKRTKIELVKSRIKLKYCFEKVRQYFRKVFEVEECILKRKFEFIVMSIVVK